MEVISASNPCMTLPTVSVGGGGDRRVSNNRRSTKAIFRACSCRMCLLLAMGNRLLANSRSSFLYFFNRLLWCRSQRNVPFQDVVGTLGQSANGIGVSVGEDGSSQFVVFISIQQLYTQDVAFHQFGHRANEDLNQALILFYTFGK